MVMLRCKIGFRLLGMWLLIAVPSRAQPYISEIRIDQPGTDRDEYFELFGDPSSSLVDLAYVVIGDNSTGGGVLESATSLDAYLVPDDGYFLAAESSFSLEAKPDATVTLNFENGDNVSHLLVKDFAGSIGQDLDLDDDGVLELQPWSEVVDCVSLIDDDNGGDPTYCAARVGPDSTGVPWHVYLDGGWNIGPGDPAIGVDTPGKAARTLPVELIDFKAMFDGEMINLSWTTGAEDANAGFIIEQLTDETVLEVAFVVAKGRAAAYTFDVVAPAAGWHVYRLRQLDIDGASRIIAATSVEVANPDRRVLSGIFPNPLIGAATYEARSHVSQFARISLYDTVGRHVKELYAGRILAGHTIRGPIRNVGLSPGVYYLHFAGDYNQETRSVVVLR